MSNKYVAIPGHGNVRAKFVKMVCDDFDRLGYNHSPTGLTAMIVAVHCLTNRIPFTSKYHGDTSVIRRRK